MDKIHLISHSTEETQSLAKRLVQERSEKIWLLYGDLGGGKTTFVKGLAEHFGLRPDQLASPTFALLSESPKLLHGDAYRLNGQNDPFFESELNDAISMGKHVILEWPEAYEETFKNQPHLKIRFHWVDESTREIDIEAFSPES